MAAADSRWQRWFPGVALFLLVWGGKLMVVDRWGSDLPETDDWHAIGLGAIVPWEQGRFGWADLFAAHNEHRVALTRALNLGLAVLNGQWDARLECVVNAVLHGLIVVGAFLLGRRALAGWARPAWWALLALLTAPPVVWENILRGFDSQHYLLIGFSLAAMAAWLAAPPRSAWWWGGLGCAGLALFTQGSGLVAAAVAAVILSATRPWRDVWCHHHRTLAACIAIVVTGLLLRVPVPGHEALRAHDGAEFWTAFYHHLQWPLVRYPFFGVISFLPWIGLAGWCAVRRGAVGPVERVALAAGLWALIHYAAMAYMRGSLQPWPPVRGLDNVVVGLAVNAFILLRAAGRMRRRQVLAWSGVGGGLAWMAAMVFGIGSIIRENVTAVLPERAARVRMSEDSTRAYLATSDGVWLRPHEIPHPDASTLAKVLDQPEIRAVLPASVRPARTIMGRAEPPASFRPVAAPDALDRAAPPPGVFQVVSDATDTGVWTSEPVPPDDAHSWLLRVGRSAPRADLALELRSTGGQLLANLQPDSAPERAWSETVVRAPELAAVLIARDRSATGGIAFSGPVSMAAGSAFARSLAHHGGWFVGLGVIVALSGVAAARTRRCCDKPGAGSVGEEPRAPTTDA